MKDPTRYERHLLRNFRVPYLCLPVLCLGSWSLSMAINPVIPSPFTWRYALMLALMLACYAWIVVRQPLHTLQLAALANIWVLALAFRIQIGAMGPTGLYWNLPIAALIALGISALFYQLWNYLLCLAGAWLILFYDYPRLVPEPMAPRSALILLGTSLLIGLAYNVFNHRSLRRTFLIKERYRILAETDALTGLANRRKLLETLATALVREPSVPLAFVMLDVDDFKRINDHHGHQVGDEVLVTLAEALRQLEPQVQTGRLGGEEFGILATGEAVKRLPALLGQTQAGRLDLAPNAVDFTFSAGVARRRSGESLTDLLRRADESLYTAKRQGKDRIVWDDDCGVSAVRSGMEG